MNMKFVKMHGCGNDYIYVNGFDYEFSPEKKENLAKSLSDRHFGIGSDGLIFINPSKIADFEMEMYNADGSRSQMCGNGIRCVAKYVYDHGMTTNEEFTIESMGAIKYIKLILKDGQIEKVSVDMGEPILEAKNIPVLTDKHKYIEEKLTVAGETFTATAVSMGNPHVVLFTDPNKVLEYGNKIEHDSIFPERVNAEFVSVIDKKNVRMRVWERGTGETLCCGTGCCATAVACILGGYTDREVTVHVIGGQVDILWNKEDGHIYMTGPAATVFEGTVEV